MAEEADAAPVSRGLSKKDLTHFLLRRLHSLAGVVPIGAFLVEHLYSNYQAVGPGGEARFNGVVADLQHNPVVIYAEIFGIGLPILYHAFYGLFIAGQARHNVGQYTYNANWRFLLQRISGIFLVLYIGYHVWNTRLVPVFHPHAEYLHDELVTFSYMHHYLTEPLLGIPTWFIYIFGLGAAVYHFANGLWSFLIHWGITVGPRAQRYSAYACAALGVLLFALGINSLYAFVAVAPAPGVGM